MRPHFIGMILAMPTWYAAGTVGDGLDSEPGLRLVDNLHQPLRPSTAPLQHLSQTLPHLQLMHVELIHRLIILKASTTHVATLLLDLMQLQCMGMVGVHVM